MKKLFALLFSFQLIVSPVLAAEATNTPAREETATAPVAAEEDAYLKSGTGGKGGYDFYANQILALGTGAIGSSIISQCLMGIKVPSIATFMGGSLVQMMAEVVGAKAKNENHQNRLKDIRLEMDKLKKSGDSAQKMALEQRLKEEEETLKFLSDRKKWMIAVTTIYAASSGLAIAEEFMGTASATTSHTVACTGFTYAALACNIQALGAQLNVKANFAHSKAAETAEVSCAGPFYAPCKAALLAYIAVAYGACQEVAVDGGASMISWNMVLSLAYGFGSSKVGSSAGGVAQYGSMLISLLGLMIPSLSRMVVPMYNLPLPRAATFGAAGIFAGVVTSGLAKRENAAKKNIGDLKKVIAEFKETAEGDGGVGTDAPPGTDEEIEDTIKIKTKIDKLTETKKKECFAKGSAGFEHSSAACSRSIKLTKTDLGKFNLPGITNVSNLTTDLANALAEGNDAKAAGIAGEIGSFAARVNKEVKDLKTAYNNQQKKDKKDTHDFDKSLKSQMASMQSSFDNAAAKANIKASDLGPKLADEDSSEAKSDAPVVTTAGPSSAVNIPVDPLAGLGGTEEVTLPEASKVAAAQSLDDFESTEQDISKKPETSIFKQLSNRYILNYTKMFETKKSIEPAKSAPTN